MDDDTDSSESKDDADDKPFPLQFFQSRRVRPGSTCFKVRCKICGWKGTGSCQKLIYGHLLGSKRIECRSCVTRSVLQEQYPTLYEQLKQREADCARKRE